MTDLSKRVGDMAGNGRLLVALSGGLDSTVLLHAAVDSLGPDRVVAGHIHHNLRASADEDAAFCVELAEKLSVPCSVSHVHPDAANTQADARLRRYAALARIADAHGCDTIATAHHADDVVETFLERLARGAGLSAMLGLGERTRVHDRPVIRPLLSLPRLELEEWAKDRGLTHREDPSNADSSYRRNAIRHNVLPALTAEHGLASVRRSIENLRGEAALVSQAVDQLVMAANQPAAGLRTIRLERRWLATADPALRHRALIETASSCGISLHHIHFESLERERGEPARIDLPGGHAIVSADLITFCGAPSVPDVAPRVEIDLKKHPEGALPWYDLVIIWRTSIDDAHLWIPEGATFIVDGPQQAESIQTSRGSKLVRELLREAGVPAEDRWRWPVIRFRDHCVSVIGIENTSDRSGNHGLAVEIARRGRRSE